MENYNLIDELTSSVETKEEIEKLISLKETINAVIDMDEIKIFADHILSLGEKYQLSSLIHYGNQLHESTEDFDIEQIDNALTIFADLIKPFLEH